jgi:hypothetical protein
MKITFEWTGTNGEPLPEEQLSERIQEVRNLDAQQLSEGALVLPGVKDGPPLRLSDNLSAIAVSFCIEAPKQLIAGRPVTIPFFASDASLTLKPDGKNVELSGEGYPTARYLKAEFLPAQLDCAERFISFFRLLHDGESGWQQYADKLEGLAAANRKALESPGSPARRAPEPPKKKPAPKTKSPRRKR